MSENSIILYNLSTNFRDKSVIAALGGGGSSGGSVVQYTPQNIATEAGLMQSQSASYAAQLAQKSIGDAISAINTQYNQAQSSVQPYKTEGVQALDQLNQYLQLDPYNPGKAPTAPVAPTLDSLKKGLLPGDINQYITDNTSTVMGGDGNKFQYYEYTGAGVDALRAQGDASNRGPAGKDAGDGFFSGATQLFPDAAGDFRKSVKGYAEDAIAQQQLDDPNSLPNLLYNSQKQTYDQDSQSWQTNEDLYNKYNAEGTFTSQQIQDKITNLPGYQAQLTQGIGAINNDSAAQGYLGSGRMLKELNTFGQNTLSQFYGNELNRLAGLAGMGQAGASASANLSTSQGNSLASLFGDIGTNNANAALTSGNALSQALISGNQAYKTVGSSSSGGGIGEALGGVGSLISAFGGL